MFRKVVLPILAIAGLLFSIFMVFCGARKPPQMPIPFPPPTSPYQHYVAGEGIIESVYKNIPIGVPFQELISDVFVAVGAIIKKGDALFKLDTRAFESQLSQAKKEQDLARIDLENQRIQFSFYQRLKKKIAVSEQVYKTAFYNKQLAQKRFDIATEAIKVIKTNLDRSIIKAPVDGEILQLNIRVGQTAILNPFDGKSLILLGDTNFYHLRVDIDEEDAWRIEKNSQARAFLRGNSKISIPLEYAYSEPYVIPKVSLSGANTERVDTRVLQIVYRFSKNGYPVYAGQLLDVYLEAKPHWAEK